MPVLILECKHGQEPTTIKVDDPFLYIKKLLNDVFIETLTLPDGVIVYMDELFPRDAPVNRLISTPYGDYSIKGDFILSRYSLKKEAYIDLTKKDIAFYTNALKLK